jgi:hypothetical protein
LAVDGTFLPAAADVAWAVAARNQRRDGQCHRARTDWHVDVKTWIPEVVVVPEPGQSEADSAATTITPGAIHVYDRGFQSFSLIAAHYDLGEGEWTPRADFVMRLRELGPNSPVLVAENEAEVSDAARRSGVVLDQVVRVPGLQKAPHRLWVLIATTPAMTLTVEKKAGPSTTPKNPGQYWALPVAPGGLGEVAFAH